MVNARFILLKCTAALYKTSVKLEWLLSPDKWNIK